MEGVRRAVRQLVRDGADFIKIMASGGGTAGTDPCRPSYSVEELRGHRGRGPQPGQAHHRPLHRHPEHRQRPGRGCRLHRARHLHRPRRRLSLPPPDRGAHRPPGRADQPDGADRLPEAREAAGPPRGGACSDPGGRAAPWRTCTSSARSRWSSWAGSGRSGRSPSWPAPTRSRLSADYCLGLELQVQAGMSPADVICSATSVAARAVGLDHLVGTVQPGREADLIIVDRDPLADIRALRSVRMVMQAGTIVPPPTAL